MSNDTAIIATFDNHSKAEDVVRELQRSGFDMTKLSIIGKGYHSEEHPIGFYTTGDRMKSWGGIGAFWGAMWGLLISAAFFWIPGIGPVAAAGPVVHLLASGLEGAAIVGGVGALGAALTGLGIPRDSVVKYERQLRADRYLIIAHGTAAEVGGARSIMDRLRATETELVEAA